MPWWTIAYLVFLVLVILISIIKDVIDHRPVPYVAAEFISGAIGVSFIVACWYTELATALSWLVIPLLIYSVAWDQYALRHMEKADYGDLTEHENNEMHKYSKLFAIFFVLPCYIAGLYLSYQFFQN
jgi:hypothetical protein